MFFIFTLLFLWSLCLICTNAICNAIKVKKKNKVFDTKGIFILFASVANDKNSITQSNEDPFAIFLLNLNVFFIFCSPLVNENVKNKERTNRCPVREFCSPLKGKIRSGY